jgi:GAF domain-containing protein
MHAIRTLFATQQSERWVRAGSVLIGFAALALFVAALIIHLSGSLFPSVLLIVVLVLLAVAIGLHVRFLLLARQEYSQTARALDAFRKSSLALTQDLSMDYVLDALLRALLDLIPCESAQVILVESETRLFLAREVERSGTKQRLPDSPSTLDATTSKFLLGTLAASKGVLISDTRKKKSEWSLFKAFAHLGSWLCVPLVASERVLGFLSLEHREAGTLRSDHLRLAQSLAIPAAVAIQNARLFAEADIFRIELEQRLADLQYPKSEAPKKGSAHFS